MSAPVISHSWNTLRIYVIGFYTQVIEAHLFPPGSDIKEVDWV